MAFKAFKAFKPARKRAPLHAWTSRLIRTPDYKR
jgi:hypothetical protein